MLWKDVNEELSSRLITFSLLFERFKSVRFCSFHNELSCIVPVRLFEWSWRVSSWVKFKIAQGIFPEKLHLYSASFLSLFSTPIEEGIRSFNPQLETSRTSSDVKFVIHAGIDPTSSNPESCNEFKDLRLPIDDGSSPAKPITSRPSFFKHLRLLIEIGIVPEKLVRPTSKFSSWLLSVEKFGRLPDIL